jgi:eukaryotic-like serine/threonine-protein kinase
MISCDVALGRTSAGGIAHQLVPQIIDRLNTQNNYVAQEMLNFLDALTVLTARELDHILYDLPGSFYFVVAQQPMESRLELFLQYYAEFVPVAVLTPSYAETVATNMREVFRTARSNRHKAQALSCAVSAAILASRLAAMNTCREMIYSVQDDELGLLVAEIIRENQGSFLSDANPSSSRNGVVRKALSEARMSVREQELCPNTLGSYAWFWGLVGAS